MPSNALICQARLVPKHKINNGGQCIAMSAVVIHFAGARLTAMGRQNKFDNGNHSLVGGRFAVAEPVAELRVGLLK